MDKYTKIPVDEIQNPRGKGVVQILEDRWWVVTPQNEILLYRGYTPQCNQNKSIVEMIVKKHPNCTVQFIELAFVPVEL